MPKKRVRFNTLTSLERKDLTLQKLQFIKWIQEVVDKFRNKLIKLKHPYKGFYVEPDNPELYWCKKKSDHLQSEKKFQVVPIEQMESYLNYTYHSAEQDLRGEWHVKEIA